VIIVILSLVMTIMRHFSKVCFDKETKKTMVKDERSVVAPCLDDKGQTRRGQRILENNAVHAM
jgi:stage III sporulation protein SpoIIIAA